MPLSSGTFTISIQGNWNGSIIILYICCPAFLKNIECSWEKQEAIFRNGFLGTDFFKGLLQSFHVGIGIWEEIIRFFRGVEIALPFVLDSHIFDFFFGWSGMIAETLYLSLKSRNIRQQKNDCAIIV